VPIKALDLNNGWCVCWLWYSGSARWYVHACRPRPASITAAELAAAVADVLVARSSDARRPSLRRHSRRLGVGRDRRPADHAGRTLRVRSSFRDTDDWDLVESRVVHGLGRPAGWVGSNMAKVLYFWWLHNIQLYTVPAELLGSSGKVYILIICAIGISFYFVVMKIMFMCSNMIDINCRLQFCC